ncbi:MAG: Crp/Fnr family transcriptional regulator [Rhizobiaceae bacterium]|nr:Crp/Fnr family transcriptional regulator [Rhizobiaceae bacterium]
MTAVFSEYSNKLLSILPADDGLGLVTELQSVSLPKGMFLSHPNRPADFCYFPENGIASVVAISPEGHRSEAGVIGWEGVTPLAPVLHAGQSPFEIFVQVEGSGFRIEADCLQSILENSASIRHIFLRYAQAFFVQCSFTSLSNATHRLEERLARWILMCHDRVIGDRIALSHEFMAAMLAVHRPSVTTALHVLEGNRFIYSERNLVIVRNRADLEEFASDAYGLAEQEYERLLFPLRKI